MKLFHAFALPFVLCTLLSARMTSAERPQEASAPAGVAAARTVILVRHAEKIDESDDSWLSPVGHEHAQSLAKLLGRSKATHLFASKKKRTQQTLEPLEKTLGKKTEIWEGDVPGLAKKCLATPAGSTIIVAGHSNTVPELADELGAPLGVGEMLTEFGQVFVLTLPDPAVTCPPTVVELKAF